MMATTRAVTEPFNLQQGSQSWSGLLGPIRPDVKKPGYLASRTRGVDFLMKDIVFAISSVAIEGDSEDENETPTPQPHQVKEFARHQRLFNYLVQIITAKEIAGDTANRAWKAWENLSKASDKTLSAPDAAPGPNGELLYTWDKAEHHFELEVFPTGGAEFFYRNRTSGELWDAEYDFSQTPSEEVKTKLRFFI
jgi:hypothetical protein